jgi:CRISP-associated protein Cas1
MTGPTSLVLSEQGVVLRLRAGRLQVEKNGQVLDSLPIGQVESVQAIGGVQITTQALRALLAQAIPLHVLSTSGWHLGRMQPHGHGVVLLRAQVHCTDDPAFVLALAQRLVAGKLDNARVVLARWGREHNSPDCHRASAIQAQHCEQLLWASDLDMLRGHEGAAARAYFAAFGGLVPAVFGPFIGRNRRPPTDPVNAMLSFGYTLLLSQVLSALVLVGLHPDMGFLHVSCGTKPALALDLLEEFRAGVVDRLVLTILNRRYLSVEDFERFPDKILLNDVGRKRFIELFVKRLCETTTDNNGSKLSYTQLIQSQARTLAQCVRNNDPAYEPWKLR